MSRGVRFEPDIRITTSYLRNRYRYDPESGALFDKKYKRTIGVKQYSRGQVEIFGRKYTKTHVIWKLEFGHWPPAEVDHRDRLQTNDRLMNLREATRSTNNINRKTQWNNSSRYKGVKWRHKTWYAGLTYKGVHFHLGRFTDEVVAAKAVDKLSKVLHGEFAILNFPEDFK